MGICEAQAKEKLSQNVDHKNIPLVIFNEIAKSICKITIKIKGNKDNYGTGFFMKINDSSNFLITNYHIINEGIKTENIEISIYNNKIMKLDLNNRNNKYFPKPKDITLIEIKSVDEIYNYIKFLNYDKNYTNGYNIYKDLDIFSIHCPYRKSFTCGSGKITSINNYEFDHNIPTDNGSSGCPILLLNNNMDLIKVIGIHKEANITKNANCGTFIGEIFNDNLYNNPQNPAKLTSSSIPLEDYCPPNPLNIKDIKQDFNSKPLMALENVGATCYMNATLQCLSNIKKFVEYFKYSKDLENIVKSDTNKEKLSSAFKLLIENLYPYKMSNNYLRSAKDANQKVPGPIINVKNIYAPRNFKETISRMNPLFEGIAANDAKDLFNFIIMTLHEELNLGSQEQNLIDNNNDNIFQEQKNKELMFKNFMDSFKKTQKSIISELFYAANCNYTQCSVCKVITYNYQNYFFLIFPLEEVRKFKLMNNNGINKNNNNIVDIYDCFKYDEKINTMDGENSIYCVYCKQTCSCNLQTKLVTGPEILIIILNRGKGNQFKVKINFGLNLNLNDFIELRNTGCKYELFGVITHIGENGMGGHFIAYCKEFWNNQWLQFNDSQVGKVNNFQREVIDFGMPYLLFYQKKH